MAFAHSRATFVALLATGVSALMMSVGCSGEPTPDSAAIPRAGAVPLVIGAPASVLRPPFQFSAEDASLLEEVQRGCFNFLWNGANKATGMVPDRSSITTVSVAGVGFQLAAIPIGVEHHWITREEGRERVALILSALSRDPAMRHEGMFQHYMDGETGGAHQAQGLERSVSTIDSGLLFAGMIVAAEYFGGDVKATADELIAAANWQAFVSGAEAKPQERGYISLGWAKYDRPKKGQKNGYFPYYWVDSGDEHKLVTFLAVCSPNEKFRVDPAMYYRLHRQIGEYPGVEPFSWFPWSGSLFTHFFAHCFIDYASMGSDSPAALGVDHRASIDWWENSRRAVRFHQVRAMELSQKYPTLGEDAWGLTASDCTTGYQVPGLFPHFLMQDGDRPGWDFDVAKAGATKPYVPADDVGDGSLAPYGAACSIMFDPQAAVRAMRHYRGLMDDSGQPLAWRDPATGGYGFVDSFRVASAGQPAWAAKDVLAIDQGPMILAIENARTGLVWRLFHEHPYVRAGLERLKLERVEK